MKVIRVLIFLVSTCCCALPVFAESNAIIGTVKESLAQRDFERAEALLQNELNKNPKNDEARFMLARVYAWNKKPYRALPLYDDLLNKRPNNSDYLLGKGLALLWNDQPSDAVNTLEKAHRVNPKDPDIWQAEIEALKATQKSDDAMRAEQLRVEAAQRFPARQWQVLQPMADIRIEKPNQVEVGMTRDFLTNNYDDWSGQYIYASHQFSKSRSVYGGFYNTNRFDLNDNRLMIGTTQPISEKWSGRLEGTYSETRNVVADWSVTGGITYKIGNGWNATLDQSRKMYDEGSSSTTLTIEKYIAHYRFAYGIARSSPDDGGFALGHRVSGDYYYGAENYVRLTYGWGEELSNEYVDGNPAAPPVTICGTRAPRGQTTLVSCDVEGVTLSGRHWFMPDWAVSYGIGYHSQDNLYSYDGLLLGLRHRF